MELNPDSTILRQLDGQWQKMAALIMWKLAGREKVTITMEDMQRYGVEAAKGDAILFTHGHVDSIDFQIVNQESAQRLIEHDRSMRGSA